MTDIIEPQDAPLTPERVGTKGHDLSFQRDLLGALLRFRDGDFSSRLAADLPGIDGEIADAFNEILAVSARRNAEIAHVCRVVGKEGKLEQRMNVPGAIGGWADEIAALNTLIDDLVWPTTEVTRAIGGVAKGDLGPSMSLDVDGRAGELLRSAQLVNRMIDQLSVFIPEVTRVAREVGTEGKLGGQARVQGVAGTFLQQWQQLTTELQTRQIELQQTNEELASKAKQLAEQNAEVERKNKEVEHARRALEEKAAELALTSKYKSEFLANMSHELRTPLNSILILGQQLADNIGGNLTVKQIDFARNIHTAGTDLLTLINDILELSKIESGTVTVEPEEITFQALRDTVHRTFHHVAEAKGLAFKVDIEPGLPRALTSDPKRLQKILKNLLSNAFKFTALGHVSLSVRLPDSGWSPDHPVLSTGQVIAFVVTDTGIGIAPEKQKLIFEAFQQADAGTSRKYGGTGLGLAISRELASLLGGEIKLISKPGSGSTFTLFLPASYRGPAQRSLLPGASGLAAPSPMPVLTVAKTEETVPDDREDIREGDSTLRAVAKSVGVKDVQSPERLLDETSLLLHRVIADLPEAKRKMIERLHGSPEALQGRKVLVVDDDARNIFALTTILESQQMDVLSATNGRQAIEIIRMTPDLSVVLMEPMMPEMDGCETMREIRKDPRFRTLPIVALTAKAMKGDREKCLEAGASDYIAKPVDADQLLSLLRVWLYR